MTMLRCEHHQKEKSKAWRLDLYNERLWDTGLQECTEQDAPQCRWVYQDLLVDVMPCDKAFFR